MPFLPDAVREQDLDHDEILRRGGRNLGDEDFALCKCPNCGRVHLIEYEVDTAYLDPIDLSVRAGAVDGFDCPCGYRFGEGPWLGPDAPESIQVTWDDLAASEWRWVSGRTRGNVGLVPRLFTFDDRGGGAQLVISAGSTLFGLHQVDSEVQVRDVEFITRDGLDQSDVRPFSMVAELRDWLAQDEPDLIDFRVELIGVGCSLTTTASVTSSSNLANLRSA